MVEQSIPKRLEIPDLMRRGPGGGPKRLSRIEEHMLVFEEKGYAFAGGPHEVLGIVEEALETRGRVKAEGERVYRCAPPHACPCESMHAPPDTTRARR